MAELDLSDFDAAEKWFAGQSAEVRSVMTSRAALRVAAELGRYDGNESEQFVLAALRCTLTSVVRGLGRTTDVAWLTDAANAARSAVNSAARSAVNSAARSAANSGFYNVNSAYSAADSAFSAAGSAFSTRLAASSARSAAYSASSAYSAARSAADSATQWDSARIEGDLNTKRLWAGAEVPPEIQAAHDDFLSQLRTNPDWDFFRTWYAQMWEGTFTGWDLATEVAKIKDDVWDAGFAEVAEAIRGIETDGGIDAHLLAEGVPLAEDVILDAETNRFKTVPIPLENASLIQTMIERVNDYLSDALLGRNGLREDESFVVKLRRANTRYQNDPQRLELDYTSATVSIRRLLASKELADTEDNLGLLDSVEEGVRALRANHPGVAANREHQAKQKLRQLSADEVALLEDAQTLLPSISADVMSEDFKVDIPQLINDATLPLPSGAPPLPGADETTRIFYRVSRMKQILDATTDKGAAVFDSKQFKTVRLGLTVTGLLSALVSMGLMIIGVL